MSVYEQLRKDFPYMPIKAIGRDASRLIRNEPDITNELIHTIGFAKNTLEFIGTYSDFVLLGVTSKTLDVSGFRTPVLLEYRGEVYLVIDLRNCTKFSEETREITVTKQNIYNQSINRAKLMALFVSDPALFENFNLLPGRVFCSLIRSVLERSRQLSREESQIVRNLAANYWLTMHVAEQQDFSDPRFLDNHLIKVCRLANTTTDLYRLNHSGEPIASLDDFVKSLQDSINTPKIKMVSPELLISLVSNTHMEHDYAYNVAVGLEYPPFFVELVLAASMNLTKSTFSDVVKRENIAYRDGRNMAKDLIKILNH